MTSPNAQFGAKIESTYATAVAVDRFWRMTKLGPIKWKNYRAVSAGLEATGLAERASTLRVAQQGGTLPFEFEVESKGFGWWLRPLMGGLSTGSATDSAYPHTGTIADLSADFFTAQANIPLHPAGTAVPFTFAGCMVPTWEIGCASDGLMKVAGDIDFCSATTVDSGGASALQSASYPTGAPFSWIDVKLSLGGTDYPVDTWSLKVDNMLNVDRYKQRQSALKQQPTRKGRPRISVDLSGDFSDLATMINRVRATQATAALAQLIVTCEIDDDDHVIGSATKPSLVITVPKVSFDDVDGIGKEGEGDGPVQKLTGAVYWDGTNSLATAVYTSADATA